MNFPHKLIPAVLIKRYKRFLADVELVTGEILTIHTANTGAMEGCAEPGSKVWISNSHNPKRKYPYSWELASSKEGTLIGINTALANKLVKEAIEEQTIAELNSYQSIATERPYGREGSRIDLLLNMNNKQQCFVEVKNVTASFEPAMAAFPDAITTRGTKHLRELELMCQQGHRAALVFCVQREDITTVRAADEIDPVYSKTLEQVANAGVEILAYGALVTTAAITLNRKLEVCL